MKSRRSCQFNMMLGVILSVHLATLPPVIAGPKHEEDTIIGHNGVGQIVVQVNSPGPNELPQIDTILHGWAADEPGNKTPDADEPKSDFFMLGDGAIINLELVSIDPALKVWSPGFNTFLSTPGQSFLLGGAEFDTHGTFHIDSTDPAFHPDTELYSVTLRVVDTGTTGYGASAPFTLSFTPVPEPTTMLLAGLGVLGVFVRRRAASVTRKEIP